MFVSAPIARSRSLVKAVTWRMLGSVDTFIVSFVVARVLHHSVGHAASMAGAIASVETVTKIFLFYFHERLWARVPWGRADKMIEVEAPRPAGEQT